MKTLLVTGGSGYLGRRIVELAPRSWHVAATYLRHPPKAIPRGKDFCVWYRMDVRDRRAVWSRIRRLQPDVIIHTAAANPGSGLDLEAVNVLGTRHVAEAAADHGTRLIHISTDLVFDGEHGPYTESDDPAPVTPYGKSKAEAETEIRDADTDALIIRTSLIYGWHPRVDRQTDWVLNSLRDGKPLTLFTDEIRNPIWVDSLARALLELSDGATTGILHVAGGTPLSRYNFGVRLAEFHGADPSPIRATPSRESGLIRPLDCRLDIKQALTTLQAPLPGADEVLQRSASGSAPDPITWH